VSRFIKVWSGRRGWDLEGKRGQLEFLVKLHTTSEGRDVVTCINAGGVHNTHEATSPLTITTHNHHSQSPLTITTHNDASIVIVLHEAVMEPHKLLMLPYRGEVSLLELLQCGLGEKKHCTITSELLRSLVMLRTLTLLSHTVNIYKLHFL